MSMSDFSPLLVLAEERRRYGRLGELDQRRGRWDRRSGEARDSGTGHRWGNRGPLRGHHRDGSHCHEGAPTEDGGPQTNAYDGALQAGREHCYCFGRCTVV